MSQRPTRTHRRAKIAVGATGVLGLLAAGPAFQAHAATSHATAPNTTTLTGSQHLVGGLRLVHTDAVPSNVKLFLTNTSLLGVHKWYHQMLGGHPVIGGLYAQHTDTTGATAGQIHVWDGRIQVAPLVSGKASVAMTSAVHAAAAATKGTPLTLVKPSLWVLPGNGASHLVWKVSTYNNAGGYLSYVDAQTGKVLQTVRDSKTADASKKKFVDGSAQVFDPNPVVKLQDESLTDQNDSNAAVPKNGYSMRTLGHLAKGAGKLTGEWATLINTGNVAQSNDYTYVYKRADDRFEQVMDYYALDTEESYYQSLGFTDVNAEPQKIQADAMSDDNSWYLSGQDLIQTGTGGVDDAEDPEVVWHEDGHATQDAQVPGFGSTEQAGAIGEGFGDYMAATMSQVYAKDTDLTPYSCLMDWDSTSYTGGPKHCIRTTVTDKMYPQDLDGEVHDDGEIWSHAVWNMNVALGRDQATTIIIEAQFNWNPGINMPDAAKIIVSTAKKLYGKDVAATTKHAFQDRGIL